MNVLYIAPLFHTNQAPIMEGFVKHGDCVTFLSHFKSATENHTACTPIILGYSPVFHFVLSLYQKTRRNKLSAYPEAFQNRYGFPPIHKLKKILKDCSPDVVILRERSVYSIICYLLCKTRKIPCILYNQSPLWDYAPLKTDLLHKIVRGLTPPIRITPVLGDPTTGYLDSKCEYVPFVMPPHMSPAERNSSIHHPINILCVGKYQERKNQRMLVDIISRISSEYPVHLTLVGEASTEYHRQYLQNLQKHIEESGIKELVSIHVNKTPAELSIFYQNADLFVLPSTTEVASIAQLEAMSYSLPVIVSNGNGTSCYVKSGFNGYLFEDNNEADLEKKMVTILSNQEQLSIMGKNSYQLVIENHSFNTYYAKINSILNQLRQ